MHSLRYRADIDGLRAVAILLVMGFHAFPKLFPGGFIGVDIFFVISGYLITRMLIRDFEQGKFSFIRFYRRRIQRIFPALLVILMVCLLSGFFLLFAEEYFNLAKHIVASSAFVNNFLLLHEQSYFDHMSEMKPLLHLWSLGIEEQFYLLWPIFLYGLFRHHVPLIWGIAMAGVLSFGCYYYYPEMSFFASQARFWELACGSVLAYRHEYQLQRVFCSSTAYALALLMLFGFVLSHHKSMIGLSSLATLVVLSNVKSRLLSHPWMIFLGLISYPLYLWHWSLLSFAKVIYGGHISTALTLLLLVVSVILSYWTYRYIEMPIRQSQQPMMVWMLCVGLLLIGGGAYFVFAQQGLKNRAISQLSRLQRSDLNNFYSYRRTLLQCHQHDEHQSCWQNHRAPIHAVVWGDSHAEHLFPGIVAQYPQLHWQLLAQNLCPPLLGVKAYWPGEIERCLQHNDQIAQAIVKQDSIRTVILSWVGLFYLSQEVQAYVGMQEGAPAEFHLEILSHLNLSKSEVLAQGLENTIQTLLQAGKKIILVEDTPLLPFMPAYCMTRPLKYTGNCKISKQFLSDFQKPYHDILLKMKKKYPQVVIFSGLNAMCSTHWCPVLKHHHLLYRDSQHLSLAGSDQFGRALKRKNLV